MTIATTVNLVADPRIARDLLVQRIKENNETLQLGFIGQDDERRLPNYPAVVVSVGEKAKEYHGTHTFNVRLTCTIWVYHANMQVGHATRSDEDLILCEDLEDIIEAGQGKYNGAFISSYVDSIEPGFAQPRSQKSDIVVGSRLLWVALSQERFK